MHGFIFLVFICYHIIFIFMLIISIFNQTSLSVLVWYSPKYKETKRENSKKTSFWCNILYTRSWGNESSPSQPQCWRTLVPDKLEQKVRTKNLFIFVYYCIVYLQLVLQLVQLFIYVANECYNSSPLKNIIARSTRKTTELSYVNTNMMRVRTLFHHLTTT